jgi:hypothetical protein
LVVFTTLLSLVTNLVDLLGHSVCLHRPNMICHGMPEQMRVGYIDSEKIFRVENRRQNDKRQKKLRCFVIGK